MKRYVSEVLPRYVTHTRHGPRPWLDYRTLDSFGRNLSLHLHFPKRYSDILRSYSIYSIHRSAAPIQPHLRSQWRIAINKSSADTAMFITALAGDESTRRSFRCCPRTDQTLTPHQLGGSGSQQLYKVAVVIQGCFRHFRLFVLWLNRARNECEAGYVCLLSDLSLQTSIRQNHNLIPPRCHGSHPSLPPSPMPSLFL